MMKKKFVMAIILSFIMVGSALAVYSPSSGVSQKTLNKAQIVTPAEIQCSQQNLSSLLNISFKSMHFFVEGNLGLTDKALTNFSHNISNMLRKNVKTSIIFYQDHQTRLKAYNVVMKAERSNNITMPIQLAHAVNKNKDDLAIDSSICSANDVVLTFNPFGIYLVNESIGDFSGIMWAVNNAVHPSHPSTMFGPVQSDLNNNISHVATTDTITQQGFAFIGQIGWFTSYGTGYTSYSGSKGNVLEMQVLTNFYETSQTTSQGTYYFYLTYTQQSAIGHYYSGVYWYTLQPWEVSYSPDNFYAQNDWRTYVFPGQMLVSWGPQNSGTNAEITYSLSAGISQNGASVGGSISYSVPGGLKISWKDSSNPALGYYNTTQTLGAGTGTTYTIDPSSIGELNPTKEGGVLPMIMNVDFKVWSSTSAYPFISPFFGFWPTVTASQVSDYVALGADSVCI